MRLPQLVAAIGSSVLAVSVLGSLHACSQEPPDKTTIGNGPPQGEPWSDPKSWPSGHVPKAGEDVVIPAGLQILLDESSAHLGSLTIEGTLVFAEKDVTLTSDWIMLHGTLGVGGPKRPFPAHATIELTGDDPKEDVMGMGTRGLMVMGGTLELHGKAPVPAWTRLAANADAGATSFTLDTEVDWKAKDLLVVAPTDFYGLAAAERIEVASSSGSQVELSAPLAAARWGQLQYVDKSGMTLTETSEVTDLVLDERAEIGNLTRNIVIQAPEDDLWKNQGFGAHVMVMKEGIARVEGVQFHRVGQAGHLARYPFHWHLWSYDTDGKELGDVDGQYIRDSVVWQSAQRCIVIHGTNGATVDNNVCHDITGHAIFLEDAVERRNKLENNLVVTVRAVSDEHLLLKHEQPQFLGGPAGFWITNPDNTVRGNAVADAQSIGFWWAIPATSIGLNTNVDIQPVYLPFGAFENNSSHSNGLAGLVFDRPPADPAGNLTDLRYEPKVGGDPNGERVPFVISGLTVFKQGLGDAISIWDRVWAGTFDRNIVADFADKAFAGTSTCTISSNLIVGRSLNDASHDQLSKPGVGLASYHSLCALPDNIFVNLPAVKGEESGAFSSDDYYYIGVDRGLSNNDNATFINTHPGFRSPSPNTIPKGQGRQNYSFAGALWDPYGYWGPAGNYWVIDKPFLTTSADCQDVKEPIHGNDKSCVGPYFGIGTVFMNQEDLNDIGARDRPVQFTRLDGGLTGDDAVWFIDDGACTEILGPDRNVTVLSGGSYVVDFPGGKVPADKRDGSGDVSCQMSSAPSLPRGIEVTISNLREADDWVLIGFPYSKDATPGDTYVSRQYDYRASQNSDAWACYKSKCGDWASKPGGNDIHPMAAVASKDAVLADANCGGYFQDKAAERLWVKLCRGGVEPANPKDDSTYALTFITFAQ